MNSLSIPRILRLQASIERPLPMLFDSPHSGTDYPDDFRYAVSMGTLRRLEDTHVNALFDVAPHYGAAWLEALFARSYIDPDCDASGINSTLLDAHADIPIRGRGLLRRFLPSGEPIYDRKVSVEEVRSRIERYHAPYNELALLELRRLYCEFGEAWRISCRSTPSASETDRSAGLSPVPHPDFLLLHGAQTCDPALVQTVQTTLAGMGYDAVEGPPYRSGDLSLAYSNSVLGFHCLQIEVNRKLYLDEATLGKNTDFESVRGDIKRLIARVAEFVAQRTAAIRLSRGLASSISRHSDSG